MEWIRLSVGTADTEAERVVRNRDITPFLFIVLSTALSSWITFAPDNLWLGRDVSVRLDSTCKVVHRSS
jgi:hypothetical protein